jgi:hypothetical protein
MQKEEDKQLKKLDLGIVVDQTIQKTIDYSTICVSWILAVVREVDERFHQNFKVAL